MQTTAQVKNSHSCYHPSHWIVTHHLANKISITVEIRGGGYSMKMILTKYWRKLNNSNLNLKNTFRKCSPGFLIPYKSLSMNCVCCIVNIIYREYNKIQNVLRPMN